MNVLYGVVCVHANGHRTVLRRPVSESREELDRFAAKRDRHPNAIALGMRHEVRAVREVATSVSDRKYVEVSP